MLESKTDIELINIVDNCELDYDIRVEAAKLIYRRLGKHGQSNSSRK